MNAGLSSSAPSVIVPELAHRRKRRATQRDTVRKSSAPALPAFPRALAGRGHMALCLFTLPIEVRWGLLRGFLPKDIGERYRDQVSDDE